MAIIYSYPIATPQDTDLLIISRTPEDPDEISNYSVNMSSVADYVIDEAFNGTDRYIPRFNGTGSLVNSVIYEDTDGHVGVGVVGSPPNPVHKFEVFDLRDENPSSDYSSVVTTHVNAPFTGGGGGILSRLSTDSGATYAGQIAFVPGTTANDIVSNIKLAIHVNSDMDTHSPSNLAGTVTHDNTNAHWILNGTLGETTTATLKVNGSTSIIGDLDVDGGLRVQNNGDPVLDINTENFTFSIGDITGVVGNAYIASDGSGSGNVDFFGDGDVRFRNAGNVGIGTTSLEAKLSVNGDSSYSSNYNFLSISGDKTGGTAVTDVKGINLNIGSNDHIAGHDITNLYGAYINNSTSGSSAAIISNWYGVYVPPADPDRVSNRVSAYFGDKVGVGTTSPSDNLEIGTNGDVDTAFRMYSDESGKYFRINSGGNFTQLRTTGDQNLSLDSGGTAGYITFAAGNSERMRVNYNGNVGIGTNSPSQKLDVVGSIEVSDGVYIGGTAAANKLDDYEEGTYTPSITATGTDTSGFSSIGYYTKIGDIAHVEMRITKFVDEDESCNVTNITLPFAANNTSTVNYKGSLWHGETSDKSNLYTLLREGTINLTPFNGPINSLLLAADENNTIGVKITYKVQ